MKYLIKITLIVSIISLSSCNRFMWGQYPNLKMNPYGKIYDANSKFADSLKKIK